MGVNGLSKVGQTYQNSVAENRKTGKDTKAEQNKQTDTSAVVYEKSEPAQEKSKKIYTRDQVTIDRLKSEADRRTQSLRDLVQKLLSKQGETYTASTDIYQRLREGKVTIDDETRAQAQKDIAEDGYWGVEQTAGRLVEFAKALSGGDQSKANEMIDAVKKGFEEATKAWGGELPEISKRTIDSAVKKLEAWRDGTES